MGPRESPRGLHRRGLPSAFERTWILIGQKGQGDPLPFRRCHLSSSILLQTKGLTKRFNGLTAVHDVSFDLKEGEVAGIIGPNGAGKSTFFNLLTGLFP
ncbi:MAG: ATP-binding cassette domain-containing protein, partial [Thermodesulfobacteriota bacterium]